MCGGVYCSCVSPLGACVEAFRQLHTRRGYVSFTVTYTALWIRASDFIFIEQPQDSNPRCCKKLRDGQQLSCLAMELLCTDGLVVMAGNEGGLVGDWRSW